MNIYNNVTIHNNDEYDEEYNRLVQQLNSLDEDNVEDFLSDIYERVFSVEPANAYSFSEEGDWEYEKDNIKAAYYVETYWGEDYNTLDITIDGDVVKSFRFYQDDYDGETFDRIKMVL